MTILFGHIYLVNFDPSMGKEYQKVRPALVVQSNTIHSELVTVIPISSKAEKKEADDILVLKDSRNRLLHNSLLKVRQISSFDKRRSSIILVRRTQRPSTPLGSTSASTSIFRLTLLHPASFFSTLCSKPTSERWVSGRNQRFAKPP